MNDLHINDLQRDGATQMRTAIDETHVQRLVEALEAGATLPPVVVYCDQDGCYWLADGWHRVQAHQRLGRAVIAAEVRSGSRRDAILHAVGANAAHGLPRTRADVRRAITSLLRDAEWRQWSDREIARRVGCHHSTVSAVRREMEASGEISQMRDRLAERNGATYTVSARGGDDDRNVAYATAALRRAQSAGPDTQARREALAQAERAIARVRDEQERQDLDTRLAILQAETERARAERIERAAALLAEAEQAVEQRDWSACVTHADEVVQLIDDGMSGIAERRKLLLADAARAAGVRAWRDVLDLAYQQRAAVLLDQSERCDDAAERARLLGHARLELACVRNQDSEEWRDLDRRQLELRTNPHRSRDVPDATIRVAPAPGERPEVTEIRRRAAALGYRCTLTGMPNEDRILIWRVGERMSDLDALTFDEARAWLDEREAEALAEEATEDEMIGTYQAQVGALLVSADLRLVQVLGVIFGRGDETDTDVDAIAREMVDAALQTGPARLRRALGGLA